MVLQIGVAFFVPAIFLGVLLLWLLPAAGVYVHASNHNRDAVLWAVITLVAGLVGVVLYLVLDDEDLSVGQSGTTVGCPDCGYQQSASNSYCSACGTSMAVECHHCGTQTACNNRYCPDCGTELRSGRQSQF